MKYSLPKKVGGLKNEPRKGYHLCMNTSWPFVFYKNKEITGVEPDVFLDLYNNLTLTAGVALDNKLVFIKQSKELILVKEKDKRYKKLLKKEK